MDYQYLTYMNRIDKTDLNHLMTEYGPDVWKYAYAITRNREQASDVAQEVFIKVYNHIGSYRGQSSLKTWLLSITRNEAINVRRSSYVRRIMLFEKVKPHATGASAEVAFLGEQSARDIWAIVMSLSTKLREVLVLDLEHDLKMSEMARLLNVSEGTVKSRLSRARKMVEKKWRENERE
ncbi:RNA polymerase sigma factor [Paenibacillus alba]|uniref:Sigma-70 family RNA polymerase sigma factor n=1 Tax=Paenibacillus alba TaxID=1197127 RepID=A0ABU6G2D3_9BACL|nr:sigma-70 family RNA polymerase sigma factor [Paenibacillus alba]MEC0228317.1 sigma-70 family RNA polymerase sigma factor [Paenibacillus alba]